MTISKRCAIAFVKLPRTQERLPRAWPMAGGEFGVTYADRLSEFMGLHSNGTHVPNRRSKKHQHELIKAAGLRSIRQSGGSSLTDVMDFLRIEQYPIVVKPNASAGTEGVKLCHKIQEATEHFNKLTGSEMLNGEVCSDVLCQEFLRGAEYVVDHVSRNGRHVTTAVWVYDKRPVSDLSDFDPTPNSCDTLIHLSHDFHLYQTSGQWVSVRLLRFEACGDGHS
jgi:biotin carboxylase